MPNQVKQTSPPYQPPDPDTLSPEQRKALMAQPWFQQVLKMNHAGVMVTQEFAQKLATQPGAQGLHASEIDLGDGRKARVVIDRATGKPLGENELNLPFEPKIETLDDPVNGQKIAVLRETPTSVRKLGKDAKGGGPINLQPMLMGGKVVGLYYSDEDGKPKPFELPKSPISGEILPEYKALMDGFGADAAATGVRAPAPTATPAKEGAPAASAGGGVQTITTAEERAKLPAGTVYRDPSGKMFRKK